MNLQEHIGKYLFLKQLERQEDYELLIAAKVKGNLDDRSSPNDVLEKLDIIEVLSTRRSAETNDINNLSITLESLWGDDQYAHLQGWSRVSDLSTDERLKAQLQPLYARPYNDKISLTALIKIMRQKNRRFPLPQALHLAHFTVNAALNLSTLYTKALENISDLVHVGYLGELSLHDHHLNKVVLGVNAPEAAEINQESFRDLSILVTALTCDIHFIDPALKPSKHMIQATLHDRFQGPPSLKLKLKELIDSLLNDEQPPQVNELHALSTELEDAIKMSSLDCPPALIETFLNSVYPFESAQAKREIQRLRQRSMEAFLPSSSRLKVGSIDDFSDGDDHTQTTLTIIPKVAASIEVYDALSTDSSGGSSEDFSVDDEVNHQANEFVLDESLLHSSTAVKIEDQNPQEDEVSVTSENNVSASNELSKTDSEENVKGALDVHLPEDKDEQSDSVKQGLLPPRPSDIHSLEAQARRSHGRNINTIDLLAPIDDFDSIDVTGVKAEQLRAELNNETETEDESEKGHFAGSFKYPENYNGPPSVITSAKVIERTLKPNQLAEDVREHTDSLERKHKKKGSPLLLAAILAVITALGSNYLAKKVTQSNLLSSDQESKDQQIKSQTIQPTVKPKPKLRSKRKTVTLPPKEAVFKTLNTVHPTPYLIWINQKTQAYSSIKDLQSLNLKSTDLVTFWHPDYLPLTLPFSSLESGKSKDIQGVIKLTSGVYPSFNLKLKISPKGSNTSVLLNEIPQEDMTNLTLPLSIPSSIEILRPKYQNHFILIKPTLESLNQQSIFLKSITRAKPTVTLRSSVGTAQLFQKTTQHPRGKKELGEGLSRLRYDKAKIIHLSAESKGQSEDSWSFSPHNRNTLPAYTLRLEPYTKGMGQLKFRGGYGLRLSIQPLDPQADIKSLRSEYKLPQAIQLPSGQYQLTVYDPKHNEQYLFTTVIYAGQSIEWHLKKAKLSDKESTRKWRVDFLRFRAIKRIKAKPNSSP